jgi:hypothetical protein
MDIGIITHTFWGEEVRVGREIITVVWPYEKQIKKVCQKGKRHNRMVQSGT